MVLGGVGDGPVANLAVVATHFHFAGPALDETFGSLGRRVVIIVRRAILGHGALGAPASGQMEKNGVL